MGAGWQMCCDMMSLIGHKRRSVTMPAKDQWLLLRASLSSNTEGKYWMVENLWPPMP